MLLLMLPLLKSAAAKPAQHGTFPGSFRPVPGFLRVRRSVQQGNLGFIFVMSDLNVHLAYPAFPQHLEDRRTVRAKPRGS